MNKSPLKPTKVSSSSAPQKATQATAPPVYKPQLAHALQPKSAKPQMRNTRTAPAAPPVYKPGATPKVLQTKSHLTQKAVAQKNTPPAASAAHKTVQRKEAKAPISQARTVQPSRKPVAFVPARAKSSTIQRAEGGSASISSGEKDLATRYEHYILPLERLARELIEKNLVEVDKSRTYEENVRDFMGLFKVVHAERSRLQDEVRARLSPEGLAFSQGQREGHKDEWTILVEAIIKNFAEKGILKRDLTEGERLSLLRYMIEGATRTRPALRQMAEDAYNKQQLSKAKL